MQEDVQNRTVVLAVSTSRMTGQVLRSAIRQMMNEMKRSRDSPPKIPRGKQTVKQLIRQGAGVSNIEITDSNIKSFERVARKYGVDFALKKDGTGLKPKYLVLFKARDADALTAAFTEFTSKVMKNKDKPSLLAQLAKYKEIVKMNTFDKVRHRDKELTR